MAFGDPMAEWGHLTPSFPDGITNSALRRAPLDVQRDTAMAWFSMNLIPYDLNDGGPYYGRGQGGAYGNSLQGGAYGIGRYAPGPLDALGPLTEEFSGSLPEDVIRNIADILPGKWMWIVHPLRQAALPEDALTALLAGLDELKRQIQSLASSRGGMGHNGPKDMPTVTELSKAATNVQEIEALALTATTVDKPRLESLWAETCNIVRRYRFLASTLALGIVAGIGRGIGVDVWSHAHRAMLAWETTHHVSELMVRFINQL